MNIMILHISNPYSVFTKLQPILLSTKSYFIIYQIALYKLVQLKPGHVQIGTFCQL